MNSINTYKLW